MKKCKNNRWTNICGNNINQPNNHLSHILRGNSIMTFFENLGQLKGHKAKGPRMTLFSRMTDDYSTHSYKTFKERAPNRVE